VLKRELGAIPPEIELAPEALAEGSVAIVLPFVWAEPGASAVRRGVFKILKPLAEERLREELALWPALGEYLEERCTHYDLPVLEYRKTLDSASGRPPRDCNLMRYVFMRVLLQSLSVIRDEIGEDALKRSLRSGTQAASTAFEYLRSGRSGHAQPNESKLSFTNPMDQLDSPMVLAAFSNCLNPSR
jgi:hypothetical protein